MPEYQKFTDAEQACISSKIATLMDEGQDREQAVAIAINECAPEKVRDAAKAQALPTEYKVTREGNLYRIHQLPIFASHQRELMGDVQNFDTGWLVQAAVTGNRRAAENFMSAAHIEHHGMDPASRKRVGFLRNQLVGFAIVDGSPADIIFSDVLVESQDKLALVADLPYRSVEIADFRDPSIDSLAFMESQAPYFRFPLSVLTGDGIQAMEGALAYSNTTQRGVRVLCRFPATNLTGPEAPIGGHMADNDKERTMHFQDDEMAPMEAPEIAEEIADEVVEELDPMMALLQEISSKLDKLMPEDAAEEDEMAPAPEEGPVAASASADVLQKLGEAQALALKNKAKLQRMEHDQEVSAFMKKVEAANLPFDTTQMRKDSLAMLKAGSTAWSAYQRTVMGGAPAPSAQDTTPKPVAVEKDHPILKHWAHDPALYAKAKEALEDPGNQAVIGMVRKNRTQYTIEYLAGIVPGGRHEFQVA